MELLPPRVANPELLKLLCGILAPSNDAGENMRLRLQLLENRTSWQSLAELAAAQGAMSPFVWALMRRSLLLPVPAGAANDLRSHHPTVQLTAVYGRHLARRQRQRDQLGGILMALNREKIEPFLLKGARYLLGPPGSWGEARDMRDIDLLLHPEDARRAIQILAAEGYTPDPRPVPLDQHLPEMWKHLQPSAIEIHTEALSFSGRRILPTDHVWRYSTRLTTSEGSFFILQTEWHLLHGLLHHQVSDRGHVRRVLAIKPLWEFVMLASEMSDTAWKSIADHMAERSQSDILASWIAQAARLYGLVCPKVITISPAADAHAKATLANAGAPDWLRRGRFLADQLRFALAKDTLAERYHLKADEVSILTLGRHLAFLARRYRGRIIDRLFGSHGSAL